MNDTLLEALIIVGVQLSKIMPIFMIYYTWPVLVFIFILTWLVEMENLPIKDLATRFCKVYYYHTVNGIRYIGLGLFGSSMDIEFLINIKMVGFGLYIIAMSYIDPFIYACTMKLGSVQPVLLLNP